MNFNPSQIMNLIGQLGGDHQQAAQQMQGMGQVDPEQHAGLLQRFGIDPQQLLGGGYQQHLDAQQQPGFSGYQQGSDFSSQQPDFGQSNQGYGNQGYGGQGYGGQGDRFDQAGGGDFNQQGQGFDQPDQGFGGQGFGGQSGGFDQQGGYDSQQGREDDFGQQGDPGFDRQENEQPGGYGGQPGY